MNNSLQPAHSAASAGRDLAFETRASCPLCGGLDSQGQFALDRFRVVRCKTCDFLYVSNVLSANAITNMYQDGYDYVRHLQGQSVNASVNVHILQRLVPDLQNKSLLDVGSGYGLLLQAAAKQFGMQAAGVELSLAERTYAQDKLGVKTYEDLSAVPANALFDVVTAFEVIEHVRDPLPFVNALLARVKVGGHLIIATDNFESAVVQRLGTGFPKWIPNEHICYFTPKSLGKLFGSFPGLKIADTCSFTPWELESRSVLDRVSFGKLGRSSYTFDSKAADQPDKGYRLFRTRLALNSVWSRLTTSKKLDGEMMYICAVKAK